MKNIRRYKLLFLGLIISLSLCLTTIAATRFKEYGLEIKRSIQDGYPIFIYHVTTGKPNYAGGVNVYISFLNISEKTIKYVVFMALPYNAVDDVVIDSMGKQEARLRYIGPCKSNEECFDGGGFENVWYDHSIQRIELTGFEITFMDGSVYNVVNNPYLVRQCFINPNYTNFSEKIVPREKKQNSEKNQIKTEKYVGKVYSLVGKVYSLKTSRVYHSKNCSVINDVEDDQLIKFRSRTEARKLGARPCKECQP